MCEANQEQINAKTVTLLWLHNLLVYISNILVYEVYYSVFCWLILILFIILEVFCAKRENIQQKFSEKTLEKLIGVILTNSKDWGKKHLQKTDIAIEEHEVEANEDRSEEVNE